jgi:tetratricopeptide (TPR) repeat protein
MTQNELANLFLSFRDVRQAEKPCRAAVAAHRKLAGTTPRQVNYQVDLARSLLTLGNVVCVSGRPGEAEKAYGEALDLLQPLTERHPTVAYYQNALAICYRGLGMVAADRLDKRKAEGLFLRAAEIFQALAERDKRSPEYRVNLTACWHEVATHQYLDGKYEQALGLFEKGIEQIRPLLEKGRPNLPAREQMWRNRQGRAQALTRLQRYPEALAEWEEALKVGDGPFRPLLEILRAITRAHAGRHADAADDVARVLTRGPCPPPLAYEVALAYAACASAASKDPTLAPKDKDRVAGGYVDKAMELLQRVEHQGLFAQETARTHLLTHVDLEPLRGHRDFQRLEGRVREGGTGGSRVRRGEEPARRAGVRLTPAIA